MRVLHCIPGFGGGGAERQLSYLAGGLRKEGVDVHIAYRTYGPNIIPLQEQDIALHALRGSSNYDPRLIWELVSTIRSVRPDLIQTWLTQMDVLAGTAALITGTPFILTERSSAAGYVGNWKDQLRVRIGRKAAAIVANSESGRDYWTSQKKAAGAIIVVPNGVPVADIVGSPPLSARMHGLQDSTKVILFAGRYSPEKNLYTLLDAIFRVLSARTDTLAVFFGEGPLRNDLIAKVARHRMTDRVSILDYTNSLWSWMRRASLFVSVSTFEGSPNTVIEAAVLKCPLVLSDIRQHTDLLGTGAATFVPHASPDAIAAGMLEALQDAHGATRKAQCAYGRASQLTVEATTSAYATLYRRVANGRPKGC